MAGTIEIYDKSAAGLLEVELSQLLKLLRPQDRLLIWSILELEAIGDLPDGKNMLDLEHEIDDSPNGLILDWETLIQTAASFSDIHDIVLVACKDVASIPTLSPEDSLFRSCEIVITNIDSALWSIYAKDDEVLKIIEVAFKNVKRVW